MRALIRNIIIRVSFFRKEIITLTLGILVTIKTWPELFEFDKTDTTPGTHVEPRFLLYEGVWLSVCPLLEAFLYTQDHSGPN